VIEAYRGEGITDAVHGVLGADFLFFPLTTLIQ
jgi:hypothetical protein